MKKFCRYVCTQVTYLYTPFYYNLFMYTFQFCMHILLIVLKELVMDILRVLSSPDLEVRKKTLLLVLQLTSTRNIEQVVMVMKKELTSTMEASSDSTDVKTYRQVGPQ